MVTIRLNYSYICDGFLIYEKFVITAAHCLLGINAISLHAVLGQHNVNYINYQDVFSVESIAIHELFDYETILNDIAILKLSKPALFSERISAICLPTSADGEVNDKRGIVAGWGRIDNDTSDILALTLQEAVLEVKNGNFPCNNTDEYDPARIYCAIAIENANACNGDSGSPLFFNQNGSWYAYGIVSYVTVYENNSLTTCVPSDPSYFTKLPFYMDWIAWKVNVM